MLSRKIGLALLAIGLGLGLFGAGFALAGRIRVWEVILIGLGAMTTGWGLVPWAPSGFARPARYSMWFVTAGGAVVTVILAVEVAR